VKKIRPSNHKLADAKKDLKDEKSKQLPVQKEERQNPFDFGGLPNRDLKKNLGCG